MSRLARSRSATQFTSCCSTPGLKPRSQTKLRVSRPRSSRSARRRRAGDQPAWAAARRAPGADRGAAVAGERPARPGQRVRRTADAKNDSPRRRDAARRAGAAPASRATSSGTTSSRIPATASSTQQGVTGVDRRPRLDELPADHRPRHRRRSMAADARARIQRRTVDGNRRAACAARASSRSRRCRRARRSARPAPTTVVVAARTSRSRSPSRTRATRRRCRSR